MTDVRERIGGYEYKRIAPLALLIHTRAIVASSWCQGSNALTAAGLPVSPMSPYACSWCLRGAAIRVMQPTQRALSTDFHHVNTPINKAMARTFGFENVGRMVQWNDTQGRTQEDVLAYIDDLIAKGGNSGDSTTKKTAVGEDDRKDEGGRDPGTEGGNDQVRDWPNKRYRRPVHTRRLPVSREADVRIRYDDKGELIK